MTVGAAQIYRQYDVPREAGKKLIDPALEDVLSWLPSPIQIEQFGELEFCGKPLETVRQQARQEVVELAIDYTRTYAPKHAIVTELVSKDASATAAEIASRPIVLSGHQPELFHPGVWFKNFLLSSLADSCNAISINFLVDNDLCRSTALRVPTLDGNSFSAKSVAFDAPKEGIPWELREVQDQSQLRAFPSLAAEALAPIAGTPLVTEMWPAVLESANRHGKLGQALAEGRHRMELGAGFKTLEVPLSHLVGTRAFARFSIQLLAQLPRFQDVYNSRREHYRSAHKIRNAAHPVPELVQQDGWIEAPWWVYSNESPQRRALWVRLTDDELTLSDQAGWQKTITGRLDCDNAATQWLEILESGVCIRPRALLTTMYLRLFVSDLFIHGIGGGKYDQLTDGILIDFFGITPPTMLVATSTLHLPLENAAPDVEVPSVQRLSESIRAKKKLLWDLRYHADSIMNGSGQSEVSQSKDVDEGEASGSEWLQLSSQKRELLRDIPDKGEKWEWHQQISSINKRLEQLASGQVQTVQSQIEELNAQLRQAQLLESREISFCLFPHDAVFSQLNHMAAI